MEIYKLVDSVMESIQKGDFYSEVSVEHIKDSMFAYLNDEYQTMVTELQVYFDIKKMSGQDVLAEDYDVEFEKIKDKLIIKLNELSRTR